MKRIAIALLLTVALCGSALACEGRPCAGTCQDGPRIVEETVDIDVAVAEVVASAENVGQTAAMNAGKLAQPAQMAVFGMSQAIGFLKHQGVEEEKLAPIVEARDKIGEALEAAGPIYFKAMAAAQYGQSLADGSNADKLRAAALYLDAAKQFDAAAEALEGLDEIEAEARQVFEQIMREADEAEAEE